MREWEINYITWRDLPRKLDGTEHKWPSDCHHAHYVAGISVKEIVSADGEEADSSEKRCPFCGAQDYKTHDVHGHYETICCKQIISTCCPGAADGQSG